MRPEATTVFVSLELSRARWLVTSLSPNTSKISRHFVVGFAPGVQQSSYRQSPQPGHGLGTAESLLAREADTAEGPAMRTDVGADACAALRLAGISQDW
jgi:hypothetical protein